MLLLKLLVGMTGGWTCHLGKILLLKAVVSSIESQTIKMILKISFSKWRNPSERYY